MTREKPRGILRSRIQSIIGHLEFQRMVRRVGSPVRVIGLQLPNNLHQFLNDYERRQSANSTTICLMLDRIHHDSKRDYIPSDKVHFFFQDSGAVLEIISEGWIPSSSVKYISITTIIYKRQCVPIGIKEFPCAELEDASGSTSDG